MWNITLCTEETLDLVSYSKERFEKEPSEVQKIREDFAMMIDNFVKLRNSLERWEATRNLQITITHLEDACIRAVKAQYMIQ